MVTFVQRGDRFHHRLIARQDTVEADASPTIRLVDSIDDPQDSPWPTGPPIQQLDACRSAAGREGIVGLGMAGTSHWSIAIDAVDDGIWFDVACRIQRRPDRLLSRYALSDVRCALATLTSTECQLAGPLSSGIVFVLRADPSSTELRPAEFGSGVDVCPKRTAIDVPSTVRWRFGFVATA